MSDWALVTGAAGDLGRAACAALARDGWRVCACDLSRPDVGDTALGFDVVDATVVDAAFAGLDGPVGAVVAAAGIQGEFAAPGALDLDLARRVLEVNVLGVLTVLDAAARWLRDDGSFVAMGSMAGVGGAPNMAAYAASKAAVVGLVKAAALDLAWRGVRVNAVSPAFIGPGAMWDNQVARQACAPGPYPDDPAAVAAQMIGAVPLGRVGTPEEVADVVAFLAGPRSSYLTGVNVEVAGGAR